jgi:ADP-ribose pyrophosphatase
MDQTDVEIIERHAAYQGYFRVDRYRLRHKRHDGGWTGWVMRECFERGHAAALLPYDPVRDEVVLIEQFRIGALAAGWSPWQVEIVAGIIEPEETPEAVARRETAEEIGQAPSDIVPIFHYISTPGGASETVALYCGRVDASDAVGLHGNPHEDEDIRVFCLSFHQAMAELDAGRLTNAVTIIALQWLARHRDDLRRRWGVDT